jgi:hypothetical protein
MRCGVEMLYLRREIEERKSLTPFAESSGQAECAEIGTQRTQKFAARLGEDFYRSAYGDQQEDFVDFIVGKSDTAIRPVDLTMLATEPREPERQTVNFDVASRREAQFSGALSILLAGIGEMKGAVELAVDQFGVNEVFAFRGFVIALTIFGADRLTTEGDFIRFDRLRTIHQG